MDFEEELDQLLQRHEAGADYDKNRGNIILS